MIEEYFEEVNGNENEFVIDSDILADWALRKIKEDAAESDRLVTLAEDEIKSLEKKIEEINKGFENRTAFLKGKLHEYFNKVEHKETKTQETYKLLNGTLTLKKSARKIVRPDDAKLLDVLKGMNADEFIQVKEVPLWGEFKKKLTITEDGQVVDDTGTIVELDTEDVPAEFTIK